MSTPELQLAAGAAAAAAADDTASGRGLARRLGAFDATMIVMGGIVGSGIFVNPHVVAERVHTPLLIVGAWVVGGVIALLGAFIYAELADRRPGVGGQYAYLRDAYHPSVAFLYGWALLLVIQTGGMAAVAVTFARYFREVTHVPLADGVIAGTGIAVLVLVNCVGVRSGSSVQSVLMLLKILAVAALVLTGLAFVAPQRGLAPPQPVGSGSLLLAFAAAMTPVMFSYGGWQTASFVSGEMRDPRRDLPRGLLFGVLGVIALYVAVNLACVHALGAAGLAASTTPASAVMRMGWGGAGATVIAVGIAISTLGFLSQGMLTAPRVYFAMADDRLFFRSLAWVHPTTRAPVVAIAVQGALSLLIALSGKYDQILNYVVSVDFIFFGLTAGTIFVFRRRAAAGPAAESSGSGGASRTLAPSHVRTSVPLHPVTTVLFILSCALIVIATVWKFPANSAIGIGILAAGIPVYLFWRSRR